MLSFLVNLTPLGIPESVKNAMIESLSDVYDYPDKSKKNLAKAISQRYHVPTEYICVGNGASDVIFRTVFALRPKKAMILAHQILKVPPHAPSDGKAEFWEIVLFPIIELILLLNKRILLMIQQREQ